MPRTEIDSSNDGSQLVASLLARIDRLMAQIAARDDRIDELLAQVKALNARIAEFEAKCGRPPKTPDNSSLPPSRGQKANTEPAEEPLADLGEPLEADHLAAVQVGDHRRDARTERRALPPVTETACGCTVRHWA